MRRCEGTGRARVSSSGPLFVCQEFAEKDTSDSGDGGGWFEIKQIAAAAVVVVEVGGGGGVKITLLCPNCHLRPVLSWCFWGVEITEMCAVPCHSGTSGSAACACFSAAFVFSPRVCFRSQDEVLARHQKLSSALQFNGATS